MKLGCKRKLVSPDSSVAQKRQKINEEPLDTSEQKNKPSITRPVEQMCDPVSVKDVCDLVQFTLLGKSYRKKPRWCKLHGGGRVVRVNMAVLEGLTQLHFYTYYTQFKHLRRKYTTRCTLAPSSDHLLSVLCTTEHLKPEPHPQIHSTPVTGNVLFHPVVQRFGILKRGMTNYLLTETEMLSNNFPLKSVEGCEGFVCTRAEGHVTDSSPLFGLDCEMCLTQAGSELTRVAVVDSRGRCVLDQLVKPNNPIINYRTKFSGITKSMLQDVNTRLQDVQSKLVDLLPPDAVLVGHSLDNDLQSLQLIHPHVIDTSLLYLRDLGQKFKLKHLTQIILKREIQSEDRTGHDPCEDALAALELAQYFISKGPRQVVEMYLQELWGVSPAPPVNGAVNGSKHKNKASPVRFGHALLRAGQSAVFVGRSGVMEDLLSSHLWRSRTCSSDRQVVSVYKHVGVCYSLSVVQLCSYTESPAGGRHEHLQQMTDRLKQMCVLFVGPLPVEYTEKKIHTLLRRYGNLRSIRLLRKRNMVFAEVEFEDLEGAQVTLQALDGQQINDVTIQVRRPVSESTLDLEASLMDLRSDILNKCVVYVSGFSSRQHCDDLLQTFSPFGPICDIITPAKNSGKKQRNARIRFVSTESVSAVMASPVQMGKRTLSVCPALTPPHMHTWTHTCPVTMETDSESTGQPELISGEGAEPTESICSQDEEMERLMRQMDKKVGKMFNSLEENTLSIIILPGTTSGGVEYPGLCFIQVK